MSWLQALGLALLLGFTAWAGTRIGNWQDDARRTKRILGLVDRIQENLEKAEKAAEEVKSARQQERRPNE